MKKLAFLAVVALLFVACSKEQRQSRKMDGDWQLETYDGQAPASGESESISFSKEKNGAGEGTFTSTNDGQSYSQKFTYQIVDDKITIAINEDGFSYGVILTIKELKRKDLTLVDPEGKISVYSKK
ncbi:MAG: lipocalin family protein [Bacteroidetes bacterium]|nr:lipocalin family protein [Bacteroidota bacterium]